MPCAQFLLQNHAQTRRCGILAAYARCVRFALLIWCVWLTGFGVAWADSDKSKRIEAANLYTAAENAALSGKFAQAAELFERANMLIPTQQAMRSAIRSRMAAGQHRIAITKAEELLRRYPYDRKSRALATETLDRLFRRYVRVSVACTSACSIRVDNDENDSEIDREHLVYLTPGTHRIVARFTDDTTVVKRVSRSAGEAISLTFERPLAAGTALPVRQTTNQATNQATGDSAAGGNSATEMGTTSAPPKDAATISAPAPGRIADEIAAADTSRANASAVPRLPLIIGGVITAALGTSAVLSHRGGAVDNWSNQQDQLRTQLLVGAAAASAGVTLVATILGVQLREKRSHDTHMSLAGIDIAVGNNSYRIGMTGRF